MTKKEILSEILDYLFQSCKDYIINNYDETEELSYLKCYLDYYYKFNKKSIGEIDIDILLKEVLDFLKND